MRGSAGLLAAVTLRLNGHGERCRRFSYRLPSLDGLGKQILAGLQDTGESDITSR